MGLHDAVQVAPQPYVILEKVRDILKADTTNIIGANWITSADYIYLEDEEPKELPELYADSSKPWRARIIVVKRLRLLDESLLPVSKHMDVGILIQSWLPYELRNGKKNTNFNTWHGSMQKRIEQAIAGQRPTGLAVSQALTLPIRIEKPASTPRRDLERNAWYSTSQYNATLEPVTV